MLCSKRCVPPHGLSQSLGDFGTLGTLRICSIVTSYKTIECFVVVFRGAIRIIGYPSIKLCFQGVDVPSREVFSDERNSLVGEVVKEWKLR